tara:strand:- start:80 stop:343 length:264 start_codon:yes stop_codon:yes gene_type:complete
MERGIWEERVKDLFKEYNSGYASIDTVREEIETELIDEIPEADLDNIMREIQEMEDKEIELLSIGDFQGIEEIDETTLEFLDGDTFW